MMYVCMYVGVTGMGGGEERKGAEGEERVVVQYMCGRKGQGGGTEVGQDVESVCKKNKGLCPLILIRCSNHYGYRYLHD